MNLDVPTLRWILNIIEKELEKIEKDYPDDGKEVVLLRLKDKVNSHILNNTLRVANVPPKK